MANVNIESGNINTLNYQFYSDGKISKGDVQFLFNNLKIKMLANDNHSSNLKQKVREINEESSVKYLTFGNGNGRVDKQIGGRAGGLSYGTIRKIEFIQDNAPEEVKQKLIEGRTTISKEYQKIQIQI